MAERVKKWKFLPGWEGKKPDISLPAFAFDLFANRGLTTEQDIYSFLKADYADLYDAGVFLNMELAVERTMRARENGERVLVYGDYDVDGITATALMFEILNKIGIQKVETYIPHREDEGYGLNREALTEIEKRADLVIAVDCGITSRELIDDSSVDFIVCDHHEIDPDRLPKKAIILHPQMVVKENSPAFLSACGMAFFFARALSEKANLAMGQEKWLLDLVALATICDIVPLVGQNRILAKWGLVVLSKTKRPGLLELMKFAGVKPGEISAFSVGFLLGPRLNASGRLTHAKKSLELLLANDSKEAYQIASELNGLNAERQNQCTRILEEAKSMVEKEKLSQKEIILIKSKDWPRGIVGIIASRILDLYGRPVIVFEDDGKVLHGSARSVDAFDITEALAHCSKHLIKFGGHTKAAGLSLKTADFEAFQKDMMSFAKKKMEGVEVEKELSIESVLAQSDLSNETLDFLEQMEPFGFGNKTPVFAIKGVSPKEVKRVGANGEHLKFRVGTADAISFNREGEVKEGNDYDIVFTVKYNHWNNQKKIDIRLIDIKLSEDKKDRKKTEEVALA